MFFLSRTQVFIFTMQWFVSCQYLERRQATRFKTPIDPQELFSQVKLPWKQVTLATCVQQSNVPSRRENDLLRWAVFCIAPSVWQPFNFHVHKCSYSTALFGELAQCRADYDKIRSHSYCNCCCLLFAALCHILGPERVLKMSLWVLLIFKRVDWELTSPDAVKSLWPDTKLLHGYSWKCCWHTALIPDNDFSHVEKRNHGSSY